MSDNQVFYQLTAIIFLGSGALAVIVAVSAARYQRGPVWRYLVYAMTAIAIWSFSDALFFLQTTNDTERWFWLIVGYGASMACAPIVFSFALYFARLDRWLTLQLRMLLWAPFLLAMVLAVTNGWHGLIWEPALSPFLFTSDPGHGFYFFLMLPVAYGLLLISIVIILQSFWRRHGIYQRFLAHTGRLVGEDAQQALTVRFAVHEQEYCLAERARADADFAREIQQVVTILKTQMQTALDHLEHGHLGATAAVLAQVDSVTSENLRKRAMAFHGSETQPADFFAAFKQYVTQFAASNGLHADIYIDADLDINQLAPMTRLQAMRILQEVLVNVGKHAQARRIETSITRAADGIALTVRDDGIGFDPALTLAAAPGAGFATMQRRTQLVSGTLAIVASPGAGVGVCATFPVVATATSHALLRGRRVLLAVSHPLVCEGLRAMLLVQEMQVMQAAPDKAALLAAVQATAPDLVLLDIDLPDADSPATIQCIRAAYPSVQIVILLEAERPQMSTIFHSGADGYLLKSLPTQLFFSRLAQIVNGETLLAPGMATQVTTEIKEQNDRAGPRKALTARQQEVFHLVAQGLTYDEIAARLYLSERTVRYHVDQIRSRLGCANRSELSLYARRHRVTDQA